MKQKQISSMGLITRCTNYKESDRIFTLISEEEGLMKFIARGAKKPKSKLSGHIEPLNYINVFYRKGAGLNAVSQVESLNSFLDIKKNYDLILEAQYLMELAENLSVEGEGNTFLFKGLISTLSNIASETNKDIQVMIFEFEILRQQGFGMANQLANQAYGQQMGMGQRAMQQAQQNQTISVASKNFLMLPNIFPIVPNIFPKCSNMFPACSNTNPKTSNTC